MEFLSFVSILVICLIQLSTCSAQSMLCSTLQTFNSTVMTFSQCQSLGSQGASVAWTLLPANNTLQVAFSGVAVSSSGWVGWGLNPTALQMVGTSALIAFRDAQGLAQMMRYKLTSAVQGQQTSLVPGSNDLVVLNQAVEISGTSFRMFATLQLNPNQTQLNHIWNRGPGVTGTSPEPHSLSPSDLQGRKSIDMSSGAISGGGSAPHQHLKNVHGILNGLSWGVILPLGAMAARYLRRWDPAWFYSHIFIQFTGYVLGVIGWSIGLQLGHDSPGIVYHQHRRIGIILFSFATLQILALVLRPDKDDEVRVYWNIYHYSLGYSVIVLGAVNIFKGLDILQPGSGWRTAYIIIISVLGGVSIFLEIITWCAYLKRNKSRSSAKNAGHEASDTEMRSTSHSYQTQRDES
ncbi:hypothetical protein O6H91_11G080300 [Diphasiastrum complanatum]|uniref:Uncharacterized protein n=1 Tax=Diphasiastrum complanatum TaxID=34168 RepID=A0ACC2CAX7_DIPCM|nr:hypothetical protein O6H91_11G080300 [Diphasiastrum complanatum]